MIQIHGSPEVSEAPDGLVVTTAELKAHLRVAHNLDDDLIAGYAAAAQALIEIDLGRSLLTQTRKLYFHEFPDIIYLRCPPVSAVSSITYQDTDNATQTLATTVYESDLKARRPFIRPRYDQVWPSTYESLNCVTVTYTAGYGDADAVPDPLHQAIKFTVATWYDVRLPLVPGMTNTMQLPKHTGLSALLSAYRMAKL